MSVQGGKILHVSDTALMVAACRALETARTDGFVNDPFAARLAGERGMAIAQALPMREMMCFGVGVRSRFLDELVTYAVTELGARTVVNLGAGLDTRPWRLALPADLRWIEVDFPEMLDYKAGLLAAERPSCQWTQLEADLSDAERRRAVFEAAGDGPGLLISEGLLMYLSEAVVAAVAASLNGTWHWLADITSAEFARRTGTSSCDSIQRVRAEGHLTGGQILDVLRRCGWSACRHRSYLTDAWAIGAERIQALAKLAASRANAEPMKAIPADDPSGVTLFALGG